MKELLDSSDEDDEKIPTKSGDRKGQYNAPSLKDLEESGKFVRKREVEDIGHTSMSDQEKDDAKRELLFKFELLKKSYKTENVPEFSVHSDYDHTHTLARQVRRGLQAILDGRVYAYGICVWKFFWL